MRIFFLMAMAVLVINFTACEKKLAEDTVENKPKSTNTPANAAGVRLAYADTLFYLKPVPPDYTVLPVTVPAVTGGYFKANPKGLDIDSITGRINISKSETGLRYKVYYVDNSGNAIDSVRLVISGIDYEDAIYELNATPTTYDTAFPIYNANPALALPCSGDDDDDDDDDTGCIFDETDLDDDGNNDIAGVVQSKLLIDEKKGTIDLEASFHAGVFGSTTPVNGEQKDFTFYYRLNDASNRALNKISVRLYYYKTKADIPQWLLDEINNRKILASEISTGINNKNLVSGPPVLAGQNGSFSSLYTIESKPKRPPLIVIVEN